MLFAAERAIMKDAVGKERIFDMTDTVCAVVVAAGSSSRMGGSVPKQLMELCGKPVLSHTLSAFEKTPEVETVVVVCREEDMARIKEITENFSKIKALVPGGKTRQASVAAGVKAAGECGFVAIHDGARPLITPEEIRQVVADAKIWGASTLAAPVTDTIKTAGEQELVEETPDRSILRAVQTPQVFRKDEYVRAMEAAKAAGKDFTDDCQLMEFSGKPVHLCPGKRSNLKLTTPEDFLFARGILMEREERKNGMRIGHGYDVHRLTEGRKLILGGVEIPWDKGLFGHSDADVLAHAIADALLGAAALGDIGKLFPDNDPAYKGADSLKLLAEVCRRVREAGYEVENIDATILAQAPKLRPYIDRMRENLAAACGISPGQVSVKATTEEGLGFTGAGEGMAAHSVCLLR